MTEPHPALPTRRQLKLRVNITLPDGRRPAIDLDLVVPGDMHPDEVVLALFPHLQRGEPTPTDELTPLTGD